MTLDQSSDDEISFAQPVKKAMGRANRAGQSLPSGLPVDKRRESHPHRHSKLITVAGICSGKAGTGFPKKIMPNQEPDGSI
jgi:hypothetical protein